MNPSQEEHGMSNFGVRYVILAGVLVGVAACDAGRDADSPSAITGPLAQVAAKAGDTPHVFAPGVISSNDEEWRITFTPDGDTAYFARSPLFFPITRVATIMRSHRVHGGWSTPEVAPFSGTYSDIDPSITSDGKRLFFSSIRPVDGVERTDLDVWMVERGADGKWGTPVNLGPNVNSPADELYPSVADDGTLYVGSDRPGGLGGWDIYRSRFERGAYQPVENLGAPVNTAGWEFNPVISPDGRRLVFTALDRPDGYGLGDLYVSYLHKGQWTPGKNLGPQVNTAFDEYHAAFSPKGDELYFIRRRAELGIRGDIFSIKVSKLGNTLRPGGSLPGAN
jgi:Tol biopolymer transport system component